MPIYEYVCAGCATRFEKLVKRFDEAVCCPNCAQASVEKQLSVFAVSTSAPAPAFAGCGAGACAAGGGCGAGACGEGACGLPD